MKKILFFALFAISYSIQAQTHSDLWLKIDEIRRTKFPETYQYKLDEKACSTCFKTVLVRLDRNGGMKSEDLDRISLANIAGIEYILASETDKLIPYATTGVNGVIEIYTHTYANANPSIRRSFNITFPAPDPWRTNGNEKKSK